jgi:hypothetical protein
MLYNSLKKIKRNNKAQMTGVFNIFTFMISSFIVVVFFAGLIYSMHIIANVMHDAGVTNDVNSGQPGYTNMTQAADQIFGQQAESIKALRMVSIVYILGLAAILIITNIFIKKHPIFFFAYILISVLAVIFAAPISNAYLNLINSGIYDGGLNYFGASNFILLNLPVIVLVISIIGTLLSLLNLIRTGSESTSL